jgi:hypothetical protein
MTHRMISRCSATADQSVEAVRETIDRLYELLRSDARPWPLIEPEPCVCPSECWPSFAAAFKVGDDEELAAFAREFPAGRLVAVVAFVEVAA